MGKNKISYNTEAKEAINQGLKITHRTFAPFEFIEASNEDTTCLQDEMHTQLDEFDFWEVRENMPIFQTDWEVYHER